MSQAYFKNKIMDGEVIKWLFQSRSPCSITKKHTHFNIAEGIIIGKSHTLIFWNLYARPTLHLGYKQT